MKIAIKDNTSSVNNSINNLFETLTNGTSDNFEHDIGSYEYEPLTGDFWINPWRNPFDKWEKPYTYTQTVYLDKIIDTPYNKSENDSSYTIDVLLAGVNKEDINLEINNSKLVLNYERKQNKNQLKEGNYSSGNIKYGKFTQYFDIEDDMDMKNCSAEYNNGLLRIEIPKKEESLPRKIDIK